MKLNSATKSRNALITYGMLLIFMATACRAQDEPSQAWMLLEAGLQQKRAGQRAAAVRVLGLIPEDPHATELAEKALKDPKAPVRAAAADALGQMHATGANAELRAALNDKQLPVVMAAAHALHLLNDPACYEVYYEVLIGERKGDSGMVAQEMEVFHDPKQVAEMGIGEGIGFVPFAGIGWQAVQTIMKDKKKGTAAKAALISALATDPDPRTDLLLVKTTQSPAWVLRVASLEAIAKRGNPALVLEIAGLLDDSRNEVKYTAAAVVIRLNDIAEAQEEGASKTSLRTELPAPELWRAMSGASTTADEN